MGAIGGLEREEQVIAQIVDLFQALCAPARLVYIPFKDGKPGAPFVHPPGSAAVPDEIGRLASSGGEPVVREETDGFAVSIEGRTGRHGLLVLEGIAFPQYRSHYLNLTLGIRHVMALAIENARHVEALKLAMMEHEISAELLHLVNISQGTRDLIGKATTFFQQQSGCQAVGIRLREGDDYPYYEARGFPKEFRPG